MQYTKTLTTKTGSELYLRNGDAPDGCAALAVFNKTHAETEYLLTYPDESSMTAEQEAEFLAQATKSAREIEILAFVDGQLAGTAGISAVGKPCKLVHRAEFGIGIFAGLLGAGDRLCPDSGVHRLRPAGWVSAAGAGRGGGQRTGDCDV